MPRQCPFAARGPTSNFRISHETLTGLIAVIYFGPLLDLQLVQSVAQRYADVLGTTPHAINANTRFADLSADSLESVELVMEPEEEYDISIPDDIAKRIQTAGDAVRYIQDQRRDMGGSHGFFAESFGKPRQTFNLCQHRLDLVQFFVIQIAVDWCRAVS